MLFSSLEFIFRFLPIFLIIYCIVPKKFQNLVLFFGSLCFYALGELKYIPLILMSVGINYIIACFIGRAKEKASLGTVWLVLGLIYNISMLFFFKYANFFFAGVEALTDHRIYIPDITMTLPLGISFYTFTIVSYLVDVYRKDVMAEKNILKVGTYVCMFPQLLSGPIVRFQEMSGQLAERKCTIARLESGLKIFTVGLGYKVILANQLSTLWNSIQTIGFESISTPLAWFGVLSYSLQIYFDFNGYSLMAIGVGEMLGFTLPVNFAHPYMAKSVSEFWRRWHITLGQWFKNYVYIPLGGNRKGKLRQIFNLFVVWFLTGLWHGAGLNFLLWGFYLFLFIACEKLLLKPILERNSVLSRVYLLFVIGLSWMIFAITDFHELSIYFTRLFPFLSKQGGIAVNSADIIKQMKTYGIFIILGIFLSTPIAMRWYIKKKKSRICITILVAVFWYSVYLLAIGSNNPFLYFSF